MEEKDPKGFTFKDRRKVSLDDLDQERPEQAAADQQEATRDQQQDTAAEEFKKASAECQRESSIPLPEVAFSTFVLSLSSSALVHLGDIPDPGSQRMDKDLPMAKQIIDTLGMLEEKTKGNLDSEEERLVKTMLYDLRMRYVQKCGK